ncbi:sensor histidine kinase [Sulfitobacter albidus]|uniref:sensor histidine kinase n=1 Tax=Sulfitobacter albidus TaxID=2829501 RepID=UPI0020C8A3BD|nr:ATP-binding protein [Sulfitobacter albidus]
MQVLNNLLTNAAKFSGAGRKITVALEQLDDSVRISVTDQGAGIPLGEQHKIFQRFADMTNSDRTAKGGTGLGLSISKAIVDMLGGTIGFKSIEGQGTTFHFTLPMRSDISDTVPGAARMRHAG